VEAVLIDAYPGLTNTQNDHNVDFGVMSALEVERLYKSDETVLAGINASSSKTGKSALMSATAVIMTLPDTAGESVLPK